MSVKNSKGTVFYGMHFYPGVAQYDDPNGAYMIFINDDTLRKMGPSFAGCPVYVEHVDGVDSDIDVVKKDADGWVIESFFNPADGKHWAKFVLVSERALSAVKRGYRLSNAYVPTSFAGGGTWNAIDYSKQVMDGNFEHLAIVQNPRYEESVIMTTEEFKTYNDEKTGELKRLSNSIKQKGDTVMKFFKRQKIENSVDIEGMMVELPLSKKEVAISKVINEYDKILNMNGYANGDHMVKVGEKDEMSVNDLVKKHMEMCNEMADMKKKNAAGEDGGEPGKGKKATPEDGEDKVDNEDDGEDVDNAMENEDDDAMENEALDIDQMGDVGDRGGDESVGNKFQKKDKKISSNPDAVTLSNGAKAKAKALKNARMNNSKQLPVAKLDLSEDQIARGKARYGSN